VGTNGDSSEADLYVRLNTQGSNGYDLSLFQDVEGSHMDVSLGILVNGNLTTTLVDLESVPYTSGDVLALVAIGTSLSILQNGVILSTVTDSTYSSGTIGMDAVPSSTTSEVRLGTLVFGSASNMAATPYSVIERYNSYATSAPYLASAFTDNASNADILQIENEGGQVIVAVDYLGNVRFNSSGLTASYGTGGSGLYTVNRVLNERYRTVPGSSTSTVALAFAAAFSTNPMNFDILQVIAPGGTIGYYIDYTGVAHGS
jgi:hypothetical protein